MSSIPPGGMPMTDAINEYNSNQALPLEGEYIPYGDLRISEEDFDQLYPMMKNYKYIFKTKFKSDEDFVHNYLSSKLWRLNNLYTIVDKLGVAIKFNMSWAQHVVYSNYLIHPRLIILKSRQQGISTFWLINFFDDALFCPNFNIGLMAQGADEAATLLERVKFAWDHFPVSVKEFLGIENDKDNAKAFSFSNGSTIFIRTSFRSATLQRLHISELGKIANKNPEKAKETNTGTLQTIAKGSGLAIESTAEGDNMFKKKWDKAYTHTGAYAYKDLRAVFLSWLDDPDCVSDIDEEMTLDDLAYFEELEYQVGRRITQRQRNFWIMQRRELNDNDDADIFQEYPATPEEAFAAVRDGAFYAKAIKTHLIDKPNRIRIPFDEIYDPMLPVHVCMDLGMNDEFVLIYFQLYLREVRFIEDYHNNGYGLEHYVDHMHDRDFKVTGNVVCPHDIEVRELSTGQSRRKALQNLGVRKIRKLPKLNIQSGIEAVRGMIADLYISERCEYTFTGLKNYSKERDVIRDVWKDKPLHNEWSHPADCARGIAVSLRRYTKTKNERTRDAANQRRRNQSSVVDGLCI